MDDDALGNDERVRRCPVFRIDAVQLKACRATAHVAGITEYGAGAHVEPRGHERHARVVDRGDETIREAEMTSLGRETDADKPVARPSDAPP